MKYSIVYDKPQRIRFRCGAYAFDKAYEGCIYNFLIEKNYVKKVEVNFEKVNETQEMLGKKTFAKMAFTCTYQNGSYNLHKYKIHKKGFKGTLELQT